jgi:hypothetical protein
VPYRCNLFSFLLKEWEYAFRLPFFAPSACQKTKEMKKSRMLSFEVSGKVTYEGAMAKKEKPQAHAYLRAGRRTIASAPVNKNGKFALKFEREAKVPPKNLKLMFGPPIPVNQLNKTNAYEVQIDEKEWKQSDTGLSFETDLIIPENYVICMFPRPIRICGIVCKDMVIPDTSMTRCCPVPYALVEVFDVDPLIFYPLRSDTRRLTREADKLERFNKVANVGTEGLEPLRASRSGCGPTSPVLGGPAYQTRTELGDYVVGEVSIGSIFEYYPLYSKDKLGEVYTDSCGEFCLDFTWFPGCTPNIDVSPDLIFRVTQKYYAPTDPDADSDGNVTVTIISEGWSSVRWDVADYHWVKLDAPENSIVACNPDCHPLLDRRAVFMGVGDLRIYEDIAQGDNPAKACGFAYVDGVYLKSPFGAYLDIRGEFGSKVEETGERYYRLSYAKVSSCDIEPADVPAADWVPITDPLSDTKYYWDTGLGTLIFEEVGLGPQSLPGDPTPQYYKIRNDEDSYGNDIYWFDHNKIGRWRTVQKAGDEWVGRFDNGLYLLKMEVFDETGALDPAVNIGDDLGRHGFMFLHVNNTKPVVEIKEVLNNNKKVSEECGSFTHEIGQEVKFLVDAYHPDDHLRYWWMKYQVGYGSNNGNVAKLSDGTIWSGDPLQEDFHGKENEHIIWTDFDDDLGLTADPPTECNTFGISVELSVHTKITNGYGFLAVYGHYDEKQAGLAVHVPEVEA